jgi:hypothetical protein
LTRKIGCFFVSDILISSFKNWTAELQLVGNEISVVRPDCQPWQRFT